MKCETSQAARLTLIRRIAKRTRTHLQQESSTTQQRRRPVYIQTGESIVRAGRADMVAMGRAQVADPFLVRKSSEGLEREVRSCTQCGGCLHSVHGDDRMYCTINPEYTKPGTSES
jgi:2,4-dienoyl-CoA reductase-like NADH-dependent reductase (Old Yellow Enzyme family)